jgi:hypothetical protein
MPARVRTRVFGNVIVFVFRTHKIASPFQSNTENVFRLSPSWSMDDRGGS